MRAWIPLFALSLVGALPLGASAQTYVGSYNMYVEGVPLLPT